MPATSSACSVALLAAVAAVAVGAESFGEPVAAHSPLAQPFRSAELVPGDVTLYFSIEGAAGVRAELADRPISRWLNEALAGGEAGRVWSQIAERAAMQPDEMFDALLGKRLAIAVRKSGAGERTEWALLTEIDPASRKAEDALRALRPIALGPRSRMAMLELPEHELLIARRGELMLVGPKQNAGLLREILRAVSGKDGGDVLASVVRQSAMGNGRSDRGGGEARGSPIIECRTASIAGLFVRHEPPLGGYSIAVANLAREDLTIRHYGEFDVSPLTRTISNVRIDPAILDAFEEQAMIALVEPTDIGRSAFETFLLATIGDGLLSRNMRANLGDRRIMVLGEVDGRQEAEPIDAHLPTAAVCFEIRDQRSEVGGQRSEVGGEEPAMNLAPFVDDFDQHMLRLARRISHLGGVAGSIDADLPGPPGFEPGEPRSIRVETGGLIPHPSSLIPQTLNWTIAEGPQGAFYVIATHPRELEGAVRAITNGETSKRRNVEWNSVSRSNDQRATRDAPHIEDADDRSDFDISTFRRFDVSVHSCGVINGPRIAHHLLALRDSELSMQIAGEDQTQREEFRAAIMLMSDLASGMERVRWRLARPSEKEVDLEVRIRLAPPESIPPGR